MRSTIEKGAVELKKNRVGNRNDSPTERHREDKTPGDKENRLKDRSKIFKYQKLHRESGRKGNKGMWTS